jgi:hypothetical protein
MSEEEIEAKKRAAELRQKSGESSAHPMIRQTSLNKIMRRKASMVKESPSSPEPSADEVPSDSEGGAASSALNELARVHRAADSLNIGFEFREVSEMPQLSAGSFHDRLLDNDSEDEPSPDQRKRDRLVQQRSVSFSPDVKERSSQTLSRSVAIVETDGVPRSLHVPIMSGLPVEQSNEEKKMHARDVLLMNELRSGKIPEQLLKKVPNTAGLIAINLSHYGLGDDLGICLGAWYVACSALLNVYIFNLYPNFILCCLAYRVFVCWRRLESAIIA